MTFNVLAFYLREKVPVGRMRGQPQYLKEIKILKQVQDDMFVTSPLPSTVRIGDVVTAKKSLIFVAVHCGFPGPHLRSSSA